MGGKPPKEQVAIQDRVSWEQPDARARLGLARDFYMPGSRLVENPDGSYSYEGGSFRTYDEAGGPMLQGERFAEDELAGRAETLGLLDQGDPYFSTRRSGINDMMGGVNPASRAELSEIQGRGMAANPFASGAMMAGNPMLDSMYDRGAGKMTEKFQTAIMPELQGTMIQQGKGIGSQRNEAAGRAQRNLLGELSGLATELYGGAYEADMGRMANAYEAERGRQVGARQDAMSRGQSLLPQLGDIRGQEFGDADRRRELGYDQRMMSRENQRRDYVNQQNAFNFQEQQPFQFAALQDTSTAGTSQLTQPTGVYSDPFATAVGGAQMASALG